VTTKRATSKPVIPKANTPTEAEIDEGESVEPTNKDLMKDMAEAQVEEQKERAAAAEYNALSPVEKKALAKKNAADAKAAKKSKPSIPKVTNKKTAAPPVEGAVTSEQEVIAALDLSATCTQNEAWDICETNAHANKAETLAEEWTVVVKELGGTDMVEANKAWAEVRTRVLEQVISE